MVSQVYELAAKGPGWSTMLSCFPTKATVGPTAHPTALPTTEPPAAPTPSPSHATAVLPTKAQPAAEPAAQPTAELTAQPINSSKKKHNKYCSCRWHSSGPSVLRCDICTVVVYRL
jgi:hypothetical protein